MLKPRDASTAFSALCLSVDGDKNSHVRESLSAAEKKQFVDHSENCMVTEKVVALSSKHLSLPHPWLQITFG